MHAKLNPHKKFCETLLLLQSQCNDLLTHSLVRASLAPQALPGQWKNQDEQSEQNVHSPAFSGTSHPDSDISPNKRFLTNIKVLVS